MIAAHLFIIEQLIRQIIRILYSNPSERFVEYKWVLDNIDKSKKKILDFGAGDSLLPSYLNQQGYDISIIDLFWYTVQKSKGIKYYKEDILDSSFKESTFDQIISVSVIEHIEENGRMPPGTAKRCINELARIFKPKGQILITVPLGKKYYDRRKLVHFEMEDLVLLKERFLYVNAHKWLELGKEEIDDKIREKSDGFKGLACLVLQKIAG